VWFLLVLSGSLGEGKKKPRAGGLGAQRGKEGGKPLPDPEGSGFPLQFGKAPRGIVGSARPAETPHRAPNILPPLGAGVTLGLHPSKNGNEGIVAGIRHRIDSFVGVDM